jgi:hypothetical protein
MIGIQFVCYLFCHPASLFVSLLASGCQMSCMNPPRTKRFVMAEQHFMVPQIATVCQHVLRTMLLCEFTESEISCNKGRSLP